MNRRIRLEEKSVPPASPFLADDPDGLRAVLTVIDALSESPSADDTFPFGSTGLHRLRVGRYRVLYTVILLLVGLIVPERDNRVSCYSPSTSRRR